MKIGTKSVLFGVHQFAVHPWFVAWAWWRLYGFPWDPRLWVAFIVHDIGYVGKSNMDGPEGEQHPAWGARVMGWLFDRTRPKAASVPNMDDRRRESFRDADRTDCMYWERLCLYHSRFLAKRDEQPFSRLCVADKLAIALTPAWLYLPLARLTGELREYMMGKGARTPADGRTPTEWYRDVQEYMRGWVTAHADGREDTWTGTIKDAAREPE